MAMIWIRKRLKKPSVLFNLTFTNFNDSQEWKLESAINQSVLKGTRIWLKTFQVQHYTHIYFCILTNFQLTAKLGPRPAHIIPVATLPISHRPPEKERSHLQRFSGITCNRAGKNAVKNIALPSSAYHVNLLVGVGIYGLSKNGGIDIELFLNPI